MAKSLPARPNLEYLKKEAKDLLEAFRRGEAATLPVVRHLSGFQGMSDADALEAGRASVSLQRMQLALAQEYGFANWDELVARVQGAEAASYTDVEQLLRWSHREIQVFLRDCDNWMVAAVAGAASPALRERLLANVSAKARIRLEATPEFAAVSPERLAEARGHLVGLANRLVKTEWFRSAGAAVADKPDGQAYRAAQHRMAHELFLAEAGAESVAQRSAEGLVSVFRGMARVAFRCGIVSLEALADRLRGEPLLAMGAEMAAGRDDVEEIRRAMVAERDALLTRMEVRQTLIQEGVVRLSGGGRTEDLRETLTGLLPPADRNGADATRVPAAAAGPSEDALDAELAGPPASRRSAAGLIPLFVAMAQRKEREGLVGLDRSLARIDDDLMRSGLAPAVDGVDPQLVRQILEARRKALRAAREVRLDMTVQAVLGICAGDSPSLIEHLCRAML